MTQLVHARVQERLVQLRLGQVATRLDSLLNHAATASSSYLDFLDALLAEETEAKQLKRTAMGMQIAHFPSVKTLEEFNYAFQPSVDKKLVDELATGRFVPHGYNVLLCGPPGVGKSHLAIGLGRKVVEAGYSVLFTSAMGLLGALNKADADDVLETKLRYFCRPKLLIIDELGYLPFEKRSAHLLFQLVSRRYESGSMMVTTNKPVTQWGGLLGDEMTAAAILDRLLHHSHSLMIQGDSYRMKNRKKAGLPEAKTLKTGAA
jgi:DNA replication protein DnaC